MASKDVVDHNGRQNAETTTSDQTAQEQNNTESSTSDTQKEKPYAKNYLRISKDNLYMIIALWMENFVKEAPKSNNKVGAVPALPQDFVEEAPESYNKVGAVLVLPNDVIYATDCSRDGVHAVQRLLMKHYDKAEGSKMFMSRKPCPMCAKLLVQAKVQRVLFLPFQPEYYPSVKRDSKKQQVDNLFTASAIAQTKFVLQIDESVLNRAQKKTPDADINNVDTEKRRLIKKYDPTWMGDIEKELPWPAFNEIKIQSQKYFQEVMEWIARVFYIPQSQSQPNNARGVNYDFEICGPSSNDFNPVSNDTHKMQAKCLIEIARFLATRTDDPKAGVGAVIASWPKMEILALGWNGFPLKAHYGEFARASNSRSNSDKDKEAVNSAKKKNVVDQKYPYIIHAEQNALLMRNKKDIEGAILFVTRSPCNECVPLIEMQGVKTVVVDEDVSSRDGKAKKDALSYKMFPEKVRDGTFICFQTKKNATDAKNIPVSNKTKRPFEVDDDEGPAQKSRK